jgi:hypothetical protein
VILIAGGVALAILVRRRARALPADLPGIEDER